MVELHDAGTEVLPVPDLVWALGSLCALHRMPFSADLLVKHFPPPYRHDTLVQAARALGFKTKDKAVQDRVFYVLPEYRGTSVAVKLLTALRRWALNMKAQELCINMSVGIEMERFNKLMVHMGFSCCGSNFSLPLAGGPNCRSECQ